MPFPRRRYLIAVAIAQAVAFLLMAMSPHMTTPGGGATSHTASQYWK